MKAFADDKINVSQMTEFFMTDWKPFWEKGEDAGYQHLPLFPKCFHRLSWSDCLKLELCCND